MWRFIPQLPKGNRNLSSTGSVGTPATKNRGKNRQFNSKFVCACYDAPEMFQNMGCALELASRKGSTEYLQDFVGEGIKK